MKLNEIAFANSAGVVSAAVYVIFYLFFRFSPAAFDFLFNAQFLGANVASLFPNVGGRGFLPILITGVVTAWIFGYLFAYCYNRFVK